MRVVLPALVVSALAGPAMVQAQDPLGTFTMTDQMGGVVTLTLTRGVRGEVTGSLASDDVSYQASGTYANGAVMGTLTGSMGVVYFSAEAVGEQLELTLFEPLPDGQPNYQTAQTLVLRRTWEEPVSVSRPDDKGGASAEPTTDAAATTTALADGLRIAFGLPRIVSANAYLSRAMVVEAVYQATALSGGAAMGRIVTTGTLMQGFGGGFQYSPQPTDRLVVHYAGQVHEFVVQEAMGDSNQPTSDGWLLSPHQLRYRHRLEGEAEADITVRYDGVTFEVSVQGWTTQWGARYDVALRASGRTAGVRDYGGQDVQTVYDLTGTVTRPGLRLEVAERHASSLVAATGLRTLPSQRGSASQSTSTLANVLTLDGTEYRFENVQLQEGARERGGQGSAGITALSGTVLRGGMPFGQFALQGGRPVLSTAGGAIAMDSR